MLITEDTKIADIFDKHGDISEVMVGLGMKGVDGNRLRRFLEKRITVKWAAKVHKVKLDEFLVLINKAIAIKESESSH
jgi:Domain of unknown function (DUF1858)